MIMDLARFVVNERPYWTALEKTLDRLDAQTNHRLTLEQAEQFHSLYQRTAADLVQLTGFAAEGELRQYLEWLVSRAYAQIHEVREQHHFRPWRWFTVEVPCAFRRHARAFQLSVLLTLAGCVFGAFALQTDTEAKQVLMPFEGLRVTPSERVARENRLQGKQLSGHKGSFSAELMTHNTQVALTTAALGVTFGAGTIISLFYNGVILGAVAFDYIHDGQLAFLAGWLLPHGVIEIPAILVGGQIGFVIAYALIGWRSRQSRAERLRLIVSDVVKLASAATVMLIWAGIVEAFVSQYHEPVLRYSWKIGFGLVEAAALTLFLMWAGRAQEDLKKA